MDASKIRLVILFHLISFLLRDAVWVFQSQVLLVMLFYFVISQFEYGYTFHNNVRTFVADRLFCHYQRKGRVNFSLAANVLIMFLILLSLIIYYLRFHLIVVIESNFFFVSLFLQHAFNRLLCRHSYFINRNFLAYSPLYVTVMDSPNFIPFNFVILNHSHVTYSQSGILVASRLQSSFFATSWNWPPRYLTLTFNLFPLYQSARRVLWPNLGSRDPKLE